MIMETLLDLIASLKFYRRFVPERTESFFKYHFLPHCAAMRELEQAIVEECLKCDFDENECHCSDDAEDNLESMKEQIQHVIELLENDDKERALSELNDLV